MCLQICYAADFSKKKFDKLVNLVADFLLEGNKSKKQYKQKEHHDANCVVKPIFQFRRIRQAERKKKT